MASVASPRSAMWALVTLQTGFRMRLDPTRCTHGGKGSSTIWYMHFQHIPAGREEGWFLQQKPPQTNEMQRKALWETKVDGSRGQEFETSLANMQLCELDADIHPTLQMKKLRFGKPFRGFASSPIDQVQG
ncbi:hypothetical protein AAY473_011826 [Plecturocebus cupreus]